MTFEAFENAITVLIALGGSTNAVLHMIAMAKSVGVAISQDDFQRLSNTTPLIADFKPGGNYLMQNLHEKGGVPMVLKYLLSKGMLHGNCITVTGKTLAENLEAVIDIDFNDQNIIRQIENPIKTTGHLQILYGNLALKGSVAKITGKEGEFFKGPARVFDGEKELIKGIEDKKIKAGDVVVIR
uniref:dihydroxy-acid dehydratase domain-containing protein n=2 Tax=Flavobacterium TaxID=237 RepID=UPI0040477D8E